MKLSKAQATAITKLREGCHVDATLYMDGTMFTRMAHPTRILFRGERLVRPVTVQKLIKLRLIKRRGRKKAEYGYVLTSFVLTARGKEVPL